MRETNSFRHAPVPDFISAVLTSQGTPDCAEANDGYLSGRLIISPGAPGVVSAGSASVEAGVVTLVFGGFSVDGCNVRSRRRKSSDCQTTCRQAINNCLGVTTAFSMFCDTVCFFMSI